MKRGVLVVAACLVCVGMNTNAIGHPGPRSPNAVNLTAYVTQIVQQSDVRSGGQVQIGRSTLGVKVAKVYHRFGRRLRRGVEARLTLQSPDGRTQQRLIKVWARGPNVWFMSGSKLGLATSAEVAVATAVPGTGEHPLSTPTSVWVLKVLSSGHRRLTRTSSSALVIDGVRLQVVWIWKHFVCGVLVTDPNGPAGKEIMRNRVTDFGDLGSSWPLIWRAEW